MNRRLFNKRTSNIWLSMKAALQPAEDVIIIHELDHFRQNANVLKLSLDEK